MQQQKNNIILGQGVEMSIIVIYVTLVSYFIDFVYVFIIDMHELYFYFLLEHSFS